MLHAVMPFRSFERNTQSSSPACFIGQVFEYWQRALPRIYTEGRNAHDTRASLEARTRFGPRPVTGRVN